MNKKFDEIDYPCRCDKGSQCKCNGKCHSDKAINDIVNRLDDDNCYLSSCEIRKIVYDEVDNK